MHINPNLLMKIKCGLSCVILSLTKYLKIKTNPKISILYPVTRNNAQTTELRILVKITPCEPSPSKYTRSPPHPGCTDCVLVSMFDFHRSDRGSIPGLGSKITTERTLGKCLITISHGFTQAM